jgi:hypothetical protein
VIPEDIQYLDLPYEYFFPEERSIYEEEPYLFPASEIHELAKRADEEERRYLTREEEIEITNQLKRNVNNQILIDQGYNHPLTINFKCEDTGRNLQPLSSFAPPPPPPPSSRPPPPPPPPPSSRPPPPPPPPLTPPKRIPETSGTPGVPSISEIRNQKIKILMKKNPGMTKEEAEQLVVSQEAAYGTGYFNYYGRYFPDIIY